MIVNFFKFFYSFFREDLNVSASLFTAACVSMSDNSASARLIAARQNATL